MTSRSRRETKRPLFPCLLFDFAEMGNPTDRLGELDGDATAALLGNEKSCTLF
jgi:hypothetical protein